MKFIEITSVHESKGQKGELKQIINVDSIVTVISANKPDNAILTIRNYSTGGIELLELTDRYEDISKVLLKLK